MSSTAPQDGWRPRAILFDLDDTLIDSSRADSLALRETLETFQHEFHGASLPMLLALHTDLLKEARDLYHRSGVMTNLPERLGRLLRLVGADSHSATKMGEYYYEARMRHLAPYPDVLLFLNQLKRRYPLGIVSNGPKGIQHRVLEAMGMADLFQTVVVAGEVGVRKPDPAIFQMALTALKTSPQEVLMAGDSYPLDVVPAMRLGMRAAHVQGMPGDLRLNPFQSSRDPQEGPCSYRVARVPELRFLLE